MFSSLSILIVADDGSKQRYINNVFSKKTNNCKKLYTRFHAKFPATILKNPYYTPCNMTHIITPSCNTDQVITPLGDMTCCISNLTHMQN